MSKSLREKINKITVQSTVAIISLTIIIVCAYWFMIKEASLKEVSNILLQNSETQKTNLIPSIILEEQKIGINLLLNKIKQVENLSSIKLIKKDQSTIQSECFLREKGYYECPNSPSTLKLAIPINYGNAEFGFLVKEKEIESIVSGNRVIIVSLFAIALFLIFSMTLLKSFKRLTATEIPNSLDQLVCFVDGWLKGNDINIEGNIQFSEFQELAATIKEVFKIYETKRNQAIVGQISSGILHDIRTDLQSILAAHCLISEATAEGKDHKIEKLNKNLFNVLERKLPHLVSVVETTLDVNREISLDPKFECLNKTIHSSISNLENSISKLDAKINIHTPKNSIKAYHDPVQIKRVMRNLIRNSLQAITENTDKLIHIFLEETNYNIKIRLEDNGSGITLKKHDLFKAFKSGKGKEGTGLGLFNSMQIINAHGGSIKFVKPSILTGACCEIMLPRGDFHE